MSKKLTTKDLEYRTMIMAFLTSQLWLEVQDEVQGTSLYHGDLKKLMVKLENKIEEYLGPTFTDLYQRDEESFRTYIGFLAELIEWTATAEFENVIDLTKALTSGQLKFE